VKIPRLSDLWRARVHLIGLGLVSIIPVMLHRILFRSRIYDLRWNGGLHPSDLLQLRWIGSFAIYMPVLVLVALIVSFFCPAFVHRILAFCVTVFLLFLLLFLFQAVFVIVVNVPPPNT
jgi:hypothetical protein